MHSPTRGFTLVELSIVLVIVGLLAGGVMAGKSIIRGGQMRAVAAEYQRYHTAINAFREKYRAIPGDMINATDYWGDNSGVGGCADAAITDGSTCNGNGDTLINAAGAASTTGELFQFWNQLALAGLIEGTYTGIAGTGANIQSVIGENVPASKFKPAGWSIYGSGIVSGNGALFDGDYTNYLVVGAAHATSLSLSIVFSPRTAWAIDTKLDDGMPATGIAVTRYWANCTNATTSAQLDAVYLLNDTTNCALYFPRVY